jgi:O-antigen ligase
MIVFLVAEVWRPHLLPGLYPVKIFSIIALTAGVFLSFSRAAWANLVLSLFVFFLLNLRGISRERIISLLKLVVVGSIILVVLVNLMGLGDFLKYRAAITQSYDTDRFAAQRYGLQAGLTHLAGVGPGLLDITFFAPHNVYIRTFGEHGVLGLVTFLALILILLIHAFFRGLRETDKPPYGISAKVVVASFVGLLFNSFVIDTIHWRHFWFLLALLWVISTTEASTYPSLPRVGGQRH